VTDSLLFPLKKIPTLGKGISQLSFLSLLLNGDIFSPPHETKLTASRVLEPEKEDPFPPPSTFLPFRREKEGHFFSPKASTRALSV